MLPVRLRRKNKTVQVKSRKYQSGESQPYPGLVGLITELCNGIETGCRMRGHIAGLVGREVADLLDFLDFVLVSLH